MAITYTIIVGYMRCVKLFLKKFQKIRNFVLKSQLQSAIMV